MAGKEGRSNKRERSEAKKLVGHSATNLEYRMAPPGLFRVSSLPTRRDIISTAVMIIMCAGRYARREGRTRTHLVEKEREG